MGIMTPSFRQTLHIFENSNWTSDVSPFSGFIFARFPTFSPKNNLLVIAVWQLWLFSSCANSSKDVRSIFQIYYFFYFCWFSYIKFHLLNSHKGFNAFIHQKHSSLDLLTRKHDRKQKITFWKVKRNCFEYIGESRVAHAHNRFQIANLQD